MNLEWGSAEVSDAKLTVELAGDMPKGWKQSFERTVALLGDGEWGEIQLKKSTVRVSDVTPGSEDKLRHHLEAVVTQANADHEVDDDEDDGGDDEPEGPDAEMADRFRGFADDEDDGETAEKDD
jgi:hypothetical protein